MTDFSASVKVNTTALKDLLIVNPLNATLNDLYHDVHYKVGTTEVDLHSGDNSLLFAGGEVYDGNITNFKVLFNGAVAYKADGFLIKLGDLFNDIGDNNHLDTIPSQIFSNDDFIRGSKFNDVLFGFDGDDIIKGNNGNDKLDGGAGADVMTGGAGKDQFMFDQFLMGGNPFDTVKDFEHGVDKIVLSSIYFPGVKAAPHGIVASEFHVGGHAADKNDFILYNAKTGALSYDQDGNGGTYHPIEFAVLTHAPTLDAHDFLVTA